MSEQNAPPQFVICLNNEDYEVSLEAWKIYQVLPDDEASRLGLIRIVDESGEDYLYSVKRFTPISLPQTVVEAFPKK